MNVANTVHTASYTMIKVTRCCSECCVSSGLYFEAAGGFCCALLVVLLFASRASSHCKYNMGALSWFIIIMKTLKTAPTPFIGRLVRCSAHGRSFARTTVYMYLSHNHPIIRTVCLVAFLYYCETAKNSGKPGN